PYLCNLLSLSGPMPPIRLFLPECDPPKTLLGPMSPGVVLQLPSARRSVKSDHHYLSRARQFQQPGDLYARERPLKNGGARAPASLQDFLRIRPVHSIYLPYILLDTVLNLFFLLPL